MQRSEFTELTERGIVLLDGATGSNLRKAGMPVGVSSERWVYEHPEVMLELQRAYVDAGSDIIYAPTFMANRLVLVMLGIADQLALLNTELVRLSRRAAGDRALVAGDLTTTGRPLEPVGSMTYQALFDLYREQIEVISAAGADLLVVETMLSIDETVCAVEAAMDVCELPVMCSLTLEASCITDAPMYASSLSSLYVIVWITSEFFTMRGSATINPDTSVQFS